MCVHGRLRQGVKKKILPYTEQRGACINDNTNDIRSETTYKGGAGVEVVTKRKEE